MNFRIFDESDESYFPPEKLRHVLKTSTGQTLYSDPNHYGNLITIDGHTTTEYASPLYESGQGGSQVYENDYIEFRLADGVKRGVGRVYFSSMWLRWRVGVGSDGMVYDLDQARDVRIVGNIYEGLNQ